MIILGLKFGFIVTEVPIWIEAVTMTMIIWDAMISPHTMYHNQVVVTSAAMMSSSEALPGGKGAEKSDWCVTGWSIGWCCTGTGTGAGTGTGGTGTAGTCGTGLQVVHG